MVAKISHFNGGNCGFYTFIAEMSSASCDGLYASVISEYAEYCGGIGLGVALGNPVCYTRADELKMGSLPTDYTTNSHYGIIVLRFAHLHRCIAKLKSSRHANNTDVFLLYALLYTAKIGRASCRERV